MTAPEPPDWDALVDEQARYYRERAGEYDDWFFRRGRYDRGAAENEAWHREVDAAREALARFDARGDVLELAAGTGLWTEQLARTASSILALDASEEMLALNRTRCEAACRARGVRYETVLADVFDWRPPRAFDVVFFGFWYSHVPPPREEAFWGLVRAALVPGGRVFLVDSLRAEASTARDHVLPGPGDDVSQRLLDNGRAYRVVKRFPGPDALRALLTRLGFGARVSTTGRFFLIAEATRPAGS